MSPPNADTILVELLSTLRRSLHACPEGSGKEAMTARIVSSFLAQYGPDELLTGLGGHGVAAVFEGLESGPTVLVRCELDAITIESEQGMSHGTCPTHAHRCGHDGHMAMVAGVAALCAAERPSHGRIVLLFQPAEETGAGAAAVLADPAFGAIEPDFAIALHNLPGYELGSVVVGEGPFTSASVGMRAELFGVPSHAAEPEKGRPPVRALSSLLAHMPELNRMHERPYRMATITHVQMGKHSFGVSPGHAVICATLRATTTKALVELQSEAAQAVHEQAHLHELVAEIEWLEAFPEIDNDATLARYVEETAREMGCAVTNPERPFRWSDDFGHLSQLCPIVYFGLGIGRDAAGLHQPEYAFPQRVLPLGFRMLHRVAMRALEDQRAVAASA